MEALQHVAFAVSDLEAAKEEIGPLFGVTWLPPRTSSIDVRLGDGSIVRRESTSVWSDGVPAIQLMLVPDAAPGSDGRPRIDHIGRIVDDFRGTVAQLEAAGCPLAVTAVGDDEAPSRFSIHDTPFGFQLELVDAQRAR
jgi:hypothetical protein